MPPCHRVETWPRGQGKRGRGKTPSRACEKRREKRREKSREKRVENAWKKASGPESPKHVKNTEKKGDAFSTHFPRTPDLRFSTTRKSHFSRLRKKRFSRPDFECPETTFYTPPENATCTELAAPCAPRFYAASVPRTWPARFESCAACLGAAARAESSLGALYECRSCCDKGPAGWD